MRIRIVTGRVGWEGKKRHKHRDGKMVRGELPNMLV